MIPDDQLRLLTAAVDGELTPAEARRVRRLIADSAEAQTLYAALQADSGRLRNLPQVVPPADLLDRVMARLPKAPPQPVAEPARPAARPNRKRPWASLAVAAALLLAVTMGSFAFFVRQDHTGRKPTADHIAQGQRPRGSDHPAGESHLTAVLPRDDGPLPSAPPEIAPPPTAIASAVVLPPQSDRPDELPPPRPVSRNDLLGSRPLPPLPSLEMVRARVPFLSPVADLDREDVRQELADELGRDPAFRIDLFVKDPVRGAELFQAAAKALKLTVHTDAGAEDRIKRKQAGGYLVYVESLTPAELRDLFVHLAADDAKAPYRVLDTLHAAPAQAADLRELMAVVGIDPSLWKRNAPPAGTGTPDPKPISAGTGDQLTKSLTTPSGKAGEKSAVLMTFTPVPARSYPAASKELKQFLDHRGTRKPGAVPAIIVIRIQ